MELLISEIVAQNLYRQCIKAYKMTQSKKQLLFYEEIFDEKLNGIQFWSPHYQECVSSSYKQDKVDYKWQAP